MSTSIVPAPTALPAATWNTLGSYAQLATEPITALPDAFAYARDILDEVDRTCSRFRPDSELVRVNHHAGRQTRVSSLLAHAIAVAVDAARQTRGLIDPTIGFSLQALGYDRDFALLADASHEPCAIPRPVHAGAWQNIKVDADEGLLTIPAGCVLDLGATGKAWASDLVAASIAERFGVDVIVSLGGDVSIVGETKWPVRFQEITPTEKASTSAALADPEDLQCSAGGAATSTVLARRWSRQGSTHHHLLDPRTGESAAGPWRTVSALGRSAVAANIASTSAILLGENAWVWLAERSVPARLIGTSGTVRHTSHWPVPVGETA
ncbi:MAG: FAD:protein FMN transferase [Actinomycetota bacterium]